MPTGIYKCSFINSGVQSIDFFFWYISEQFQYRERDIFRICYDNKNNKQRDDKRPYLSQEFPEFAICLNKPAFQVFCIDILNERGLCLGKVFIK
jgi:hypothetical protein